MRSEKAKNLSIVGAGRVGTAFALGLSRKGYKILSVVSKSSKSAKRLASNVRCSLHSNDLRRIHPETNLLLIAIPDSAIVEVAAIVSQLSHVDPKHLTVFHTSGMKTSDELNALQARGASVFSLHPMQSFPHSTTVSELKGVSFGFEGLKNIRTRAQKIVDDLGGELVHIPKEAKILYHCACVIASNYPVVLLNAVDELARRVLKPNSLRHFRKLTESSVRNAFESPPRRALTGPIARGDVAAVKDHLRALLKRDKDLVGLYRVLGLNAARMMVANGVAPSPELGALQKLLSTEFEHLSFE